MRKQPLLSCLRAVYHDQPERLVPLAEPEAGELARLLHHHMLAARAQRVYAARAEPGLLPRAAREALFRGRLHALALHAAYGALLESLRFSVPWAPLKGIALGRRIYAQPLDRAFSDLDLLFYPEHREAVVRELGRAGFREVPDPARFSANLHKLDFVHAENGDLKVEAHFGLGPAFSFLPREGGWVETFADSALENCYLLQHALVQHRLQKLSWLLDLRLLRERRGPAEARWIERCGLGNAARIAERWLPLPEEAALGDIMLARIDGNPWKTARLRARLMGGWLALARYARERSAAHAGHL